MLNLIKADTRTLSRRHWKDLRKLLVYILMLATVLSIVHDVLLQKNVDLIVNCICFLCYFLLLFGSYRCSSLEYLVTAILTFHTQIVAQMFLDLSTRQMIGFWVANTVATGSHRLGHLGGILAGRFFGWILLLIDPKFPHIPLFCVSLELLFSWGFWELRNLFFSSLQLIGQWKSVGESLDQGVILYNRQEVLYSNTAAYTLLGVEQANKESFKKDIEGLVKHELDSCSKQGDWKKVGEGNKKDTQLECKVIEGEEELFGLVVRRSQESHSKKDRKMKNNYKKMLLISFSHEFRTPINGVLTILPLLKERLEDEQDRYQVDAAITSAKFLNNYVNNCLDYMSIEANEFELKKKPFNLDALLSEVLGLIMMQANRKGLVIDLQKESGLPEIINSDEARLQQILLTLLMNAVKFTSKGTVTLRLMKDRSESQMLKIEVEDTGIGIPFEKKVQLFKLFGGDTTTNYLPKDTNRVGFGLTISNLLCKHLGKELLVDSELNKGTTFTFWLKLEIVDSPLKRFKQNFGASSKSLKNFGGLLSNTKLAAKQKQILGALSHPKGTAKEEKKTTLIVEEDKEEDESDSEADDKSTNEFLHEKDIKEIKVSRPKTLFSSRTAERVQVRNSLKSIPSFLKFHQSQKTEKKLFSKEIKLRDHKLQETPTLLRREMETHSPHARGSGEFTELIGKTSKPSKLNALSFVPGKNMALNKEFLQDKIASSSQRNRHPTRKQTLVYDKSMVNMNHVCKCPIILIVDDNEINKIALSGMLQRFGLIHREASNGVEALGVMKEQNRPKSCCKGIKLVLMDYDMPVMDGITASRHLTKMIEEEEITPTTVVAVTAYEGTSIEKECLDAGMKEYIRKPVPLEKLYDCIQRILNR